MTHGPGRRNSNDAWNTGRKLECCFSSPIIMKVQKILCKICHLLKDTHQLDTVGAQKGKTHTGNWSSLPTSFPLFGLTAFLGSDFSLVCSSQQQMGSFVILSQFSYIHFESHHMYSLHSATGRKCGQHTFYSSPQDFLISPSTFQVTTSSKTRNSSTFLASEVPRIPVGMQGSCLYFFL